MRSNSSYNITSGDVLAKHDSFDRIASRCEQFSDAIRWACVLEATAPKAGNVFPGHDFVNLRYQDFILAAEITADVFATEVSNNSHSFSHAVLTATRRITDRVNTNVNLGILLLVGPLAEAERISKTQPIDLTSWKTLVRDVLAGMDSDDAARLYQAINLAAPGGMGKTKDMDLSGPPPARFVDAMKHAASRDRIARNYADGFEDLFANVIPVLRNCLDRTDDVLLAISLAHLELLAAEPDSLIGRKFGPDVASQVQRRAQFDHFDSAERNEFDRYLRAGATGQNGEHGRLNPGTTADLIAAGLSVILHTNGR